MKSEKARLTRISNIIKEKFSDEIDLFGYNGVTKNGIIDSLSKTYDYLNLLEEVNDDIEIVWVKRKLAKQLETISEILKLFNTDTWMQQFDKFLDTIFEMRISVKELYISLTDKPLRAEEEIIKAKDEYKELKNSCELINNELEIIKTGAVKTQELHEELEVLKKDIVTANAEAKTIIKNITEIQEKSNKSNIIIEEITPKITTTMTEIKEQQKNLNMNEEKLTSLTANCEKSIETIKNQSENLQEQINIDNDLQEKIKETLQDVNKHGMAGAFYKRKRELGFSVFIWGFLSVISLAGLIFISYLFAISVFNIKDNEIIKHLFKLPSVAAGIWLCWFCAKQFGYTIRIWEDYSYKYAISMAFEGYKNETREINPDLLEKLLEVTMVSISTNPIILYNTKSNHGSPMHELTDGLKSLFNVKADIKASIDTKDIPKIPLP